MIIVPSIESYTSNKILSLEKCIETINNEKLKSKTVGLCHGGFDLVHPGHVKHFEAAKKYCDSLVVSTTSDRFIANRKSSDRPIYPETLRAYALASVEHVDYVTIADFRTALEVIERLKPNFYFKGPDFIGKFTPELEAEKELIEKLGGKLILTTEPNLSTTSIINYIKNELNIKNVLLCIDRDGTLIKDKHFLGRNENWKEEIEYNEELIGFLNYIDTKSKTTKVIVINQAGVARNLFDEKRVQEINSYVDSYLKTKGVKIDSWQYCPIVTEDYVKKHTDVTFNPTYVGPTKRRKPQTGMVIDALNSLNKTMSDFQHVIVIGDRSDDENLAKNLNAQFIDVNNKRYWDLAKEIDHI